ncbi:hypothetical protein [Rickettsia australis]|uniref:Uncharacterized protein n=1 Tax=Rickettsia australis (strain Cutlack) TaxID=1105110 RepID=H8K7J2_RICAC|nr:hypothetical protein [Rickettsia australis]AFC71235.1 hypothetical protein MC5_04685 [Rickettsia australis str. Cutlack]
MIFTLANSLPLLPSVAPLLLLTVKLLPLLSKVTIPPPVFILFKLLANVTVCAIGADNINCESASPKLMLLFTLLKRAKFPLLT